MADHSRRRRKCPPNAPHEALRPAPSSSLDGRQPPEQAGTIFKGLRVYGPHHTPAGTKERFEGHTPPQHPQHYIRLLGGSSPINLTRRNKAQCLVWGGRGVFPLSAAMVVTVFCSLPEHEQLFPVEPRHSGYSQNALVSSETNLWLYRGKDVEIKEKRR